jgi:hypothetical protein
MAPEPRTERLEIRISQTELEMLRQLAEAEGLSQADILRQCIRQRHTAKFGVQVPTRKKR